jgi:hypothetical protein
MERRELLSLLGVGAAGVMMSGTVRAADDKDHKDHKDHAHGDMKQMHEHMKTMGECAMICNMTATHCLKEAVKDESKDREMHARAAAMANDCQTFCVQTVTLMARHSPLAEYAHKACADACRDCAEACSKGEDEMMKKCAEICRECEKACRACCSDAAA